MMNKLWNLLLVLQICCIMHVSAEIKISVLSHGPGLELYSSFGHSAIRVKDDSTGLDKIYNYGVFDFNDPNFLKKFVQGKTYYYIDEEEFLSYMSGYIREGRWTKEQLLDLSPSESAKIYQALVENAKEENKYYLYDIFENNCSSKIWELIKDNAPGIEVKGNLNPEAWSYKKRVLEIYKKLDLRWTGFGVNIVMGANGWHVPNNDEMTFLPDFLHENIDRANLNGRFLSKEEIKLSQETLERKTSSWLTHPSVVFLFIAFILFMLYSSRSSMWKPLLSIICVIMALLGLLILGLGIGTTHPYLSMNLNILWANPLFLLILWKPSTWRNKALHVSRIMLLFVIIFSILNKDIFPVELFPLWVVLWFGIKQYYSPNKKLFFNL